jgi:hypothetical protein
MSECYFDAAGCYVCPEVPTIPAKPATTVTDAQLGWNAGADSKLVLAGNAHVIWQFDTPPAGVIVGFKANRQLPAEIALVLHGLYVTSAGNSSFVTIFELGKQIGPTHTYIMSTPLEIRRAGLNITYWNNGVLIGNAEAKTMAPLFVNTCLYAAGDTVP